MSKNTGNNHSDQIEQYDGSSRTSVWIVLGISTVLAVVAVFGAFV